MAAELHSGWERRAARLLRSQGAAIITDVLPVELGAALHSQLGKAAKAAAHGGSDSGGRTVATSRTFESNKREHFGVSLRAAAARATVDALASALHPVLSRALGLGGDAIIRLVESGCIVAEGGAIRQRVHTDTAGAAAAAAGAEAIALKIQVGAVNITTRMGAIEIEPASHFDAAAPGAARRPDADDAADEYPLVSLPIPAGGVAIYDTRLRHRGGQRLPMCGEGLRVLQRERRAARHRVTKLRIEAIAALLEARLGLTQRRHLRCVRILRRRKGRRCRFRFTRRH